MLLAVALLLRIAHTLLWHGAGNGELYLDAERMAQTARGLGAAFPEGNEPYLLSPLYPYLMAPFLAMEGWLSSGHSILVLRLAQSVLGSATALLAARMAAPLGGNRAGWIAGLLVALHGPTIYYETEVLLAGPQAFMLMCALRLAQLGGQRDPEHPALARTWFFAGWSLGIAAALRPIALPLALVLFAQAWRSHGRPAITRLLAGLSLAVLPFTAHNLITSGEPILLSAGGGFNFWVGNHADAPGTFDAPPEYDLASDPVGRNLAQIHSGAELSHSEASSWWRRQALDHMAAHPLDSLALFGRKALLFFHPDEIPQLAPGFHATAQSQALLRWPVLSSWLLILALLAPLANPRSRALAASLWLYAGVLVLFFMAGRYRAPILPLAATLAGITLSGLAGQLAIGKGRMIFGMVLFIGVGLGPLIRNSSLAIDKQAGLDMQARRSAMELIEKGAPVGAIRLLQASLSQRDNLSTRTTLGLAFAAASQPENAAQEFRRVLRTQPAHPDAAFHLAALLIGPMAGADDAERLTTTRSAEGLYRAALSTRPEWAEAHFNLGVALLRQLRLDESIASINRALQLAGPSPIWEPEARRALQIARNRRNAPRLP